MSLKDDTLATPAAGPSAEYSGDTRSMGSERSQGWGFFGSSNLGGVSRQASSEVLTKAQGTLKETYEKTINLDKPLEIELLAVDNSKETKLYLSSVIVCLRDSSDKSMGVSYHTLLLEGSNDPMVSRQENYNNGQIIVDRFAGDVNDQTYTDIVHQIVTRAFPGQECRANSAQVVPRAFNWEDKDAVRNLAINGLYPVITDMETKNPEFDDINLTKWNHDSALQVQVNFNEPERVDYAGLPVRNNVAITLTAIDNSKRSNQEINNQERQKKISQLGGFMDLVWAPEQAQVHPYGGVPQGPNYKYAARFVMTNMENVLRMTPASQLLAMVTALTLRDNNNWYPYYSPRPQGAGGRQIDIRDIGAINIEANVLNETASGGYGTRIDTKTATFSNQELGRLLSSAVRPGLTFSVDVSEAGADTWYNEIFLAAAAGSIQAQQAIRIAADSLTGGLFSQIYNSNESPVIVNEDTVHLGYYTGADGLKHDIRDIDYLAILNLQGDADPAAAQAWSDTFLRQDYPLIKRLAERKKMIQSVVPGDVVFTGKARRVTMMGKFLEALAISVKQAGLEARVTSPSFGGDYLNQRAVAGYLPQSSVTGGNGGLFNSGFGAPAAASYGQNRSYSSRGW